MEDVFAQFLTGGTLAAAIVAYKIFQIIAKTIPDETTGVLGFVRKLSKVLSLYVVNNKGKPNGPSKGT